MPFGITDNSLGARFWITNDQVTLQAMLNGVDLGGTAEIAEELIANAKLPASIAGDEVLTSLAQGTESARLKSSICGAKLVGSALVDGQNVNPVLDLGVDSVTARLGIDKDRFAKALALINRRYLPESGRPSGELRDEELAAAKTAFAKTVLSDDFMKRSVASQARLGISGMRALMNASLGMMKLIREGVVEAGSDTTDFIAGEVIDVDKPGDMLKLATKTANKVYEEFVDEAKLKGLLLGLPPATAENADRYEDLAQTIHEVVSLRKDMAKGLQSVYDLGDGSVGAVKKNLKALRNALCSFRYDFDRLRGQKMGQMEALRRYWSNGRMSDFKSVTHAQYDLLKEKEARLNSLLTRLGGDQAPRFTGVDRSAESACDLTHEVNNHIRYCLCGAGSKQERFAAEVHEMFDGMVAAGGRKTIGFEIGLDYRFGLKVHGAEVDAKVGAKFKHTAEIAVKAGGGEVTVTYYNGGGGEASAKAALGHSASDWNQSSDKAGKTAVSGGVDASAEAGGGKGRTVTYRSLDDFIADVKDGNALTKESAASQLFFAGKVLQGLRAVGRGMKNFATWMGFRIHKSHVDSAAFRTVLRQKGVLSDVDRLLKAPSALHAVKTSEKTYALLGGNAGIHGEISLDVLRGFGANPVTGTEVAKESSVVSGEGGVKVDYQRQVHVAGTSYRAKIDTLRLQGDNYLDEQVQDVRRDREDWDVGEEGTVAVRAGKLERKLRELEESVEERKLDEEQWREVCAKVRLLTLQYVKLEHSIQAEIRRLERADVPDAAKIAEAREQLANLQGFLEGRLMNPNMAIPEDVFTAELLDKTGTLSASTGRFEVDFSVGYNALTGLMSDLAVDNTKALQGAKLNSFGKNMASDMIGASVGGAMGNLGFQNKVSGSVTVEEPHVSANEHRPWKKGKVVTIGLDFDVNMPVNMIVNVIADKYIASKTGDTTRTKAEIVAETMATLLGTVGITGVMGSLAKMYGHLTFVQALELAGQGKENKVLDFLGAPFKEMLLGPQSTGLEIGMKYDFTKRLNFRFEGGRLACFSIADTQSSEMTLGARFAGFGAHFKTMGSEEKITHSIYRHPSFATMLGKAEEFVHGGTREGLKHFLTHNKIGALRLFEACLDREQNDESVLAASSKIDGTPRTHANYREDQAAIRETLDFMREHLEEISRDAENRAFASRAVRLMSELDYALGLMEAEFPTEAAKIDAFANLVTVLVQGYDLVREVP